VIRPRWASAIAVAFLLTLAHSASAGQAFNIDFGDVQEVPADSYGAASGQTGVWNDVLLGATALVDTSGAATATSVTVVAAAGDGTYPGSATSDSERLLYDNFYVGGGDTWTVDFDGLADGSYLVLLYAPSNTVVPSGDMLVGGAPLDSIPGAADGILSKGTSYTRVIVQVSGGTLAISGSGTTFSGLAGLQLVPREVAINIDFGVAEGAPSDAYGAAAGMPGHWNEVGLGLTPVLSTAGTAAGVSVYVAANDDTGTLGPATTDNELLLFDNFYRTNGGTWTVDVNDLAPGMYRIYLYAPSNASVPSGALLVGGIAVASLPGDTAGDLIEGTSYAVVDVMVMTGKLPITGSGPSFSGLAGLQIDPLPEPSGDGPLAAATVLLLALTHVRRRTERRSRAA